MLFVQGGCKPGDTVLVQGAGGGVATALIALARAGGLKVLATSRDEAKRQRALELGAHEVFETGAAAAGHGRRGDGDRRPGDLVHSIRSLRPGGTLVTSGTTSGQRRRGPGPDPHLLPAAAGRRLDDGHPRRARVARLDARRDRRPPAHRPHAADGAGPRGLRGDGRRASSSARSSSPDEGAGHRGRVGHRRGHLRRPPRARRRPRAAGPQRAAGRGPAGAVRRRGRPRGRPGRVRDAWPTPSADVGPARRGGARRRRPRARSGRRPAPRGPDRPAAREPGRARPS